ncbi:hypothetical protein ACRRTK_022719 [Alexandromys fortis]
MPSTSRSPMRYPLRHGATCWSFRASALFNQRQRPHARPTAAVSVVSGAGLPRQDVPSTTGEARRGRGAPDLPGAEAAEGRLQAAGRESAAGARPSRPVAPVPPRLPARRPRLPAVSGGRSRPAQAAEAAGPDRPLRRCSGPVTPGASVAPASGEGERPRPGLPGEAGDPSGPRALSFPDAGTPRLRVQAAATSVCVLTQSRISEVSGLWWPEGGDAPHTEASSRELVRSASAEELPRSRRCPRAPHARRSGRPPEADGERGSARGSARVRAPRLQGAQPSAVEVSPSRAPRTADDLASLLRRTGVHRESELRRGQEWVSSAPHPSPVSITATPSHTERTS